MTTPFSNNFPFSPLQDPIPPMPAASTPNNNTNPGTPFLDDMRDSKEGILLLNHGHYASAGTSHHATDKQQQSGNVGALGSLLNHGDATSSSNSVAESGRLRILLMQRPGNAAQQQQQQSHLNSMNGSHLLGSLGDGDCGGVKREKEDQNGGGGGGLMSGGSKGSHGNRILKGLLNQDDGDEVDHLTDDNRFPPQRGNSGNSSGNLLLQVGDGTAKPGNSVVAATTSNNNNNNNMLHKLLNVRSDDDGEERLGLRRPNELLKKLLKEPDEDHQQMQLTAAGSGSSAANQQQQLHHQDQQTSFQEDQQQLLKSFGFPSPTTTTSSSSGSTQTGPLANILGASRTHHLKSPPSGK